MGVFPWFFVVDGMCHKRTKRANLKRNGRVGGWSPQKCAAFFENKRPFSVNLEISELFSQISTVFLVFSLIFLCFPFLFFEVEFFKKSMFVFYKI